MNVIKSGIFLTFTRSCVEICYAQQIDLEFELKYQSGVGDMMSTLIPTVVDFLLQYAAERSSRPVRDVATAHGKTTGLYVIVWLHK